MQKIASANDYLSMIYPHSTSSQQRQGRSYRRGHLKRLGHFTFWCLKLNRPSNRKANTMDHPYQPNKFINQVPPDYVIYGVETSSDNIGYIVKSQLSHVVESKVKQEEIMPDRFVKQIKTEANPYSEDIRIKLEPSDETNTNDDALIPYVADVKFKLETTEESNTIEDIENKLESFIAEEFNTKNETPICNETDVLVLSKGTVPKRCDCQFCKYSSADKGKSKKIKKHAYKCIICKFEGMSKINLDHHILNTHPGKKPYKCKLCEFRAPVMCLLDEHRKIHKGMTFLCKLCNFKTLSINELLVNQHKKEHEGSKIFICDLCGYKSSKEQNYKGHMNKHKLSELVSGDRKIPFENTLNKLMALHSEYKKPYVCIMCKHESKTKISLEKHIKVHVIRKLMQLHIKSHDKENQFVCKLEGKLESAYEEA